MPNNSKVRFLDPAFGTGSFYSALQNEFPDKKIEFAKASNERQFESIGNQTGG